MRDPKRLVKAVEVLIDEFGGTSAPGAVQEVLLLALKQASHEGPTSLKPYEVLLIRLTKYVAMRVPAEIYRDRGLRRQVRRHLADLLVQEGLDPTGARVLPRP